MTFQTCAQAATSSIRRRDEPLRYGGKGAAMPTNKTTTIQARVSKQDKKFLRDYAESQGITLSELLRRSTTALIQIIKAQQASKRL